MPSVRLVRKVTRARRAPLARRVHKVPRARMVLTERTVRRWITDGTLPSVKIGGARLVARAELVTGFAVLPGFTGSGL